MVRLLLNASANTSVQGGHYDSTLYAALVSGSEQIVEILLNSSTVIRRNKEYNNILGKEYCRALHLALAKGRTAIVQRLLNAGANVNAQGRNSSALYVALASGSKQVVKQLVTASAYVNAQGGRDGNAL